MRKPYSNVKLDSWLLNANTNRLLEHIQYLTHENDKHKRLYKKKLREIRKLKEEADQ